MGSAIVALRASIQAQRFMLNDSYAYMMEETNPLKRHAYYHGQLKVEENRLIESLGLLALMEAVH